ncbi:iron-containing redox enzyme family protein [Amycolatopsis sp. CA-230715]|uniref:iron-containing redox enzyme family protein n=1 Tax=Amycolatopsis sp. CA-230715 TaxID=2745196 RepID=UPI001C02ECBB|nr:iron-containing redox enzyme family protein [Amycolatopsis sp. CA-230715]
MIDSRLRVAFTADIDSGTEVVDQISSWLTVPAAVLDAELGHDRARVVRAVESLNSRTADGDPAAFHCQQLLLSRIYETHMKLPDGDSAEGSVVLHEVTRLLEQATIAAEDARIPPETFDGMPSEGKPYLSWLKGLARGHSVFKHPYYVDFINHHASRADLRTYVIQESLVDGRFDDLLAMMQVGTNGPAKMEIANNFWDEMGNGDPAEVHTHLFNKIYEVFDITADELEDAMTATDLLSGNLAVLLCRYRRLHGEAVGFLGMTEWLVPDRFQNVVRAWERLGLPDVGITYHRLHITVDSQHAAGWFHNVVLPASSSEAMRRGIARGSLWRLNSSGRHLDERLAAASARS